MILFTQLLLAHLIGDFLLQPNKWVLDKEKKQEKSIYLYLHVALHFVLMLVFVGQKDFLFYALLLALSHGIIDLIKLKFQKNKTKRYWFLTDQLLHLIFIFIVVLLFNKIPINRIQFSPQKSAIFDKPKCAFN